jgi:hypothetical protein
MRPTVSRSLARRDQPQWVLDIPTSYMLKNLLQASASQIALFRLLTGIPISLGLLSASSETYGIRLDGSIQATFGSSCRSQ